MEHKNTVILDSNIWIGYFCLDDALHEQSENLVSKYKNHLKLIPEYVVLETISVIKLHVSEKHAKQCLDIFHNTEKIEVLQQSNLYQQTCSLFQNIPDTYLSFVDVSLLALSQEYEVVTLDKKLASEIKKLAKKIQ